MMYSFVIQVVSVANICEKTKVFFSIRQIANRCILPLVLVIIRQFNRARRTVNASLLVKTSAATYLCR